MMSFSVERPGFFTTIQDLGRWGHQFRGVPVSGAMDPFSLRMGNAMLGNEENAAALEITVMGPELITNGACCVVLAGGSFAMTIDGREASPWTVYALAPGSSLSIAGALSGRGCRSYLCVSGGIEVPLVMGSRSTYTRGKLGGHDGRALKPGDVLASALPEPLWARSDGFVCPDDLRPFREEESLLYAMPGPQADFFTKRGMDTFFAETYTVANQADRMGYRLEGPEIERSRGADIISDGIALGAVQVPGHGRPIVMMADRQTTGGYAKIAVLCAWSTAALARKLPGESIRFDRVARETATEKLARFEDDLRRLVALRATYRSRRYW